MYQRRQERRQVWVLWFGFVGVGFGVLAFTFLPWTNFFLPYKWMCSLCMALQIRLMTFGI